MEIREAVDEDIPAILQVLKASLGEISSQKTEEVWRYKHILNPFGRSLVLLAVENDEIIGVRAFMRWNWQKGDNQFSAFRAVDTATHPDHQGKGVFKRLTLKALEIAKNNGDHFVFNTPNKQSKPGYLKMGWLEVSKLYVKLIPVNPFVWRKKSLIDYNVRWDSDDDLQFFEDWLIKLKSTGKLFTPKSRKYLKWRYVENPLQEYKVVFNEKYFIAGYVKKHKNYSELRISELFINDILSKKIVQKEIRNWAKDFGVNVISLNPAYNETIFPLAISGKFGPSLTFKKIDEKLKEEKFLMIKNWQYSLGDMELF